MTHPDSQIVESQRALMNEIAKALDGMFNPGATGTHDRRIGFVLLTFPYAPPGALGAAGDEPRCNYISNGANRKDMASLMREMAARFERPFFRNPRGPGSVCRITRRKRRL